MILGDAESSREENKPPRAVRLLFPLMVIAALAWLAAQTLRDSSSDEIVYSDLVERIESSPQSIRLVTFVPRNQEIEADLVSGATLETHYPSEAAQLELQHLLQEKNVRFDSEGTGSSPLWSLLTTLLPFVLLLGFWLFLIESRNRRTESRRSEVKSRPDEPKGSW